MIRIEIKTKHPSLNEWLSSNGGWYKKAAQKKQFEAELLWELKAQKCPRFKNCITINVTQFTTRMRDVDNCVVSAKYLADALRAGEYITNDTPEFLKSITLQWKKAVGPEKVVYLISEC